MPKEKFYNPNSDEPDLVVAWGDGEAVIGSVRVPGSKRDPYLRYAAQDISGLNRLIRSLKRARDYLQDGG